MGKHVIEVAQRRFQRALSVLVGRPHAARPVNEIESGTVMMDVHEIGSHGIPPALERLRFFFESCRTIWWEGVHLRRAWLPFRRSGQGHDKSCQSQHQFGERLHRASFLYHLDSVMPTVSPEWPASQTECSVRATPA